MSKKFTSRDYAKKESLKSKLDELLDRTVAILPTLEEFELPEETSPLPSSYISNGHQLVGSEVARWADTELKIRIGIGHDVLEELRNVVGLQHYLLRKVKISARGFNQMKAVSRQQSKTKLDRETLITNYIKNWEHIKLLIDSGSLPPSSEPDRLQGLQPLDRQKDVQFFKEWGAQAPTYSIQSDLNVTWIWKVAMGSKTKNALMTKSNIEQMTAGWESEGKFSLS